MRYVIWLLLALATAVDAQRQQWQIGGAARVWSDSDSLQVLIDYDAAPGAIQPVYIDSSRSMLTLFAGWQPLKEPRELFYIEGETPRAWKGANGNVTTAHNGTYMVDGDSLTFNPPVSSNPESVWYTIDLAVPVPAHRFGFLLRRGAIAPTARLSRSTRCPPTRCRSRRRAIPPGWKGPSPTSASAR